VKTAEQWIHHLGLEHHPEGGWYRQTYRAPLMLPQSVLPGYGGDRAASTAIYFLLEGNQFSAFHRLRSDEVWHFYAGSGLIVHVIEPDGNYSELLLGSDEASRNSRRQINSRPSSPQAAGSAPRCASPAHTHWSAAP
jgi:uncharacterized protein